MHAHVQIVRDRDVPARHLRRDPALQETHATQAQRIISNTSCRCWNAILYWFHSERACAERVLFDPRMLATEMYLFAYAEAHEDTGIYAAAGVHVFSRKYAVAPTHRRKGLARRITARLCERLRGTGVRNMRLITAMLLTDCGNRPLSSSYSQYLVRAIYTKTS